MRRHTAMRGCHCSGWKETYFSKPPEINKQQHHAGGDRDRACQARARHAHGVTRAPARDEHGSQRGVDNTVNTCTIMVGLTMPVPRNAEDMETSANCSASPGKNQYRVGFARLDRRFVSGDRAQIGSGHETSRPPARSGRTPPRSPATG